MVVDKQPAIAHQETVYVLCTIHINVNCECEKVSCRSLDHPTAVLIVVEVWVTRRVEWTIQSFFKHPSTAERVGKFYNNGRWDSCKLWGEIAGICEKGRESKFQEADVTESN